MGAYADIIDFVDQFESVADACGLLREIVDTVREPFLVVQGPSRDSASRHSTLNIKVDARRYKRQRYRTGRWAVEYSKLRLLLEKIIPEHGVMEYYEVDHDFPGPRTTDVICLNARQSFN